MKKSLIKAVLAVTVCIFVALGVSCTNNNSKKDSPKDPSSGGSGVIETPMIKFD